MSDSRIKTKDSAFAPIPQPPVSRAAYREFEALHEYWHEYHAGVVSELPGATVNNGRIKMRLLRWLSDSVAAKSDTLLAGRVCIRIDTADSYRYASLVLIDGKCQSDNEHGNALLAPRAIIEITRPSMLELDQAKFEEYQSIPSLKELMLVFGHTHRIEQFVRQSNNKWERSVTTDPETRIQLASIDCELAVSDVYAGVDFSKAEVN